MNAIFQLIYTLTTALLVPVVAALLLLLAASLYQLGALVGAWSSRRKSDARDRWRVDPSRLERPDGDPLPRIELDMTRELSRLRWIVRVAPMLGLMGTLIPMGPALAEFSDGDLRAATTHVVIAFGTTVLGLAAAAVNYTAWQVRKLWYARDLLELEGFLFPR